MCDKDSVGFDFCPNCGESDTDNLVWIDDEYVHCETCEWVCPPTGGLDNVLMRISAMALRISVLANQVSDTLKSQQGKGAGK